LFARLGTWCHRRRRLVVVAWLAVVIVGGMTLGAVGTESRSEFELPDVESRRGTEILEDNFGGQGAGMGGSIVFQADQGVDDSQVRSAMEALFARVEQIDGLAVTSPYEPQGAQNVAAAGDLAGRVAFAEVELPSDATQEEALEITEEIKELIPQVDGVEILLGGTIFAEFEAPSSEVLGLAFAIVILILAFGSVLAMGLPIGVALAGVGMGTILAGLLSHLVTVPEFANILGVMIGLGVGIDYALFIVTRFRENLHKGHSIAQSTAIAIDTAGRAVVFAATTVVISLLGMVVMGMSFVTGLAINAATVVALTMVASLTLLPALLGFAGERVEVTRWRGLIAAGLVAVGLLGAGAKIPALFLGGVVLAALVLVASLAVRPLRAEVPRPARRPLDHTAAYRWSRSIQRHPWRAALVGAGVLVVLALPVAGLRLGFSDEGNYPEGTDTREAYDLLARAFGPGSNGKVILAAEVPEGTDPAALDAVTAALGDQAGVAFASPARLSESGEAAVWLVVPDTAPQDEATTDLVGDLRHLLPRVTDGSGLDVAVSGTVAIQVDFSDYLTQRLFVFLAAVLTLSFLLLMVVFRSLLVPLKAVVMNLLSIGAAFGVVVAAYQWGWAGPLLGIDSAPIEPFLPMMLFAIVFGLSMDYEVFLLSRVKEEWDRTGDSHTSVADGLAATARVITAAALIMVFVFGSFLLENDRIIKLFGTGLATAVLLDATVVRMLLVPATMELLGDRNWWLPRWLDGLLPKIDVEGGHADDGAPPTDTDRQLEHA
jgi:RND superfamily putative drug exporter